jgi:hypothetical protein
MEFSHRFLKPGKYIINFDIQNGNQAEIIVYYKFFSFQSDGYEIGYRGKFSLHS